MAGRLVEALRQAVAEARAASRSLPDLDALPPDDAAEAAELIATLHRLATGQLIDVAGYLDDEPDTPSSVVRRAGEMSPTAMLSRLTGIRRSSLRSMTRLARATRPHVSCSGADVPAQLPAVAAALRSGLLSIDQATVIHDALGTVGGTAHPDDVDAAERALVDAGTGSVDGALPPLSPELLAIQGRAWRAALDPDGVEPTFDEQRRQRSFRLAQRADGMWHGRLVCTPEQGERIRLALDAWNAPRVRAVRGVPMSGPAPEGGTGDVVNADADASADGPASTDADADLEPIDERTASQRQCDTLVELVARAVEAANAPRIGGEAATLVVTMQARDLVTPTPRSVATLARHGDAVPARIGEQVLCDGFVQLALLDDGGKPLRLGRRQRLFSPTQRRAVMLRDGGCVAPGCDRPPGFCEVHHVVPWHAGGATDADNGVLLCGFHHHEVHRGRLQVAGDGRGGWRVRALRPPRSRHALAA